MKRLIILLSFILGTSTACTSITTKECTWAGIIKPSRQDTIGTKKQVLEHNLNYERECSSVPFNYDGKDCKPFCTGLKDTGK
jgi:hypothetical protein